MFKMCFFYCDVVVKNRDWQKKYTYLGTYISKYVQEVQVLFPLIKVAPSSAIRITF